MAHPRSSADRVDRILSLSAIVAAAAAVGVAVYEAHIDREHQRVSVWPYVQQYNSNDRGVYTRNVQNVGIGPALVRSFQVRVDGAPQRNWSEVVGVMTGVDSTVSFSYGSLGRGMVLLPGVPYTLLTLTQEQLGLAFWRQTQAERLSTRVCYCSLYGECWVNDSLADEPEAVAACPADPAEEFEM